MSDERTNDERAVDELLHADGARWRAGQRPPPEPDTVRLAAAGRARRLGGWQPLAAAAAVLLLAGGVVGAVASLGHSPTTAVPDAGTAGGTAPAPSLRQQLVRDGDLVTAYGDVVAVPGRPVRFCAPVPTAAMGTADGRDQAPAYCDEGVTLLRADLSRLSGRHQLHGVVWGQAAIRGRYRGGTVTVTRQGGPPSPTLPPVSFPDKPPCPPPPGGWARGALDNDGMNRLDEYLRTHPDQFGEIVITYPAGPPSGPTDRPGYYDATQVALVSTVVDPAAAERALRAVFGGNLCVVRTRHNRAEVDAVGSRVNPLMDRSLGIYTTGPDYYAGTYRVELVVLDQRAYDALVAADRGTGLVVAQPWLTNATR